MKKRPRQNDGAAFSFSTNYTVSDDAVSDGSKPLLYGRSSP
jgi:hypothetical protein